MRRRERPARILLANLHATSRPAIVVPWLLAQCLTRRVDAVLLQECTDRHARYLRRLPRWQLVREGDEAILGRRRLLTEDHIVALTGSWRGHHTTAPHAPRTIPTAVLRGWLTLVDVHFPPGWEHGPEDRRKAGAEYLNALEDLEMALRTRDGLLFGGDWNATRLSKPLRSWWQYAALTQYGHGIDYVAGNPGVYVASWRRIGRALGMDHDAALYVLRRYPRKASL